MTPEQREAWMAGRTKHGGYLGGKEQPEHYVWRTMIARCTNPKANSYNRYGARGIRVCKRWQKYENFLADMGKRPSEKHSLDRINNDGDYKPSNCRWALPAEQSRNKRNSDIYKGPKFSGVLSDCAAHLGISKELAYWRWKTWGTLKKGETWQRQKKLK
jgi:hypothetical protein